MIILKLLRFQIIIMALTCCSTYAEIAVVKDGDTIKIGSSNIRLYGIDAPETKQKCYYLNGESWNCGMMAKIFLEEFIDKKDVDCILQNIDLYKREVHPIAWTTFRSN